MIRAPNLVAYGLLSFMMVGVVAGCDEDGRQVGFPAGTYEVTFQSGSEPPERPECLDESLLLLDVVTLFHCLAFFEIDAVDELGEPTSESDATYWGFIQCATSDCDEDPYGYEALPLLGSPTVDTLTGGTEMLAFGFSVEEEWAECVRIVLTSELALDEENQSVHLEFTNRMAFQQMEYDASTLDQLEVECFSAPPELGTDPCTRLEVLEGVLID